jgi:hypothetical protein
MSSPEHCSHRFLYGGLIVTLYNKKNGRFEYIMRHNPIYVDLFQPSTYWN